MHQCRPHGTAEPPEQAPQQHPNHIPVPVSASTAAAFAKALTSHVLELKVPDLAMAVPAYQLIAQLAVAGCAAEIRQLDGVAEHVVTKVLQVRFPFISAPPALDSWRPSCFLLADNSKAHCSCFVFFTWSSPGQTGNEDALPCLAPCSS